MATVTSSEFTQILIIVSLLLFSAQLFGFLFSWWKMPKVVGEIVGGFIFGPTVLGSILPNVFSSLFGSTLQQKFLSLLAWLGLLFLMFVSGFEMQPSLNRSERRAVKILLGGATFLPLAIGWYFPLLFPVEQFLGPAQNMIALRLVLALAIAVTSIPVISKIFLDLGIIETPFAKIVLATAVIEDIILWAVLAIATGIVDSNGATGVEIIQTIATTLLFLAITLLFGHRILSVFKQTPINTVVQFSPSGAVVIACLLCTGLASMLGVNLVFGALVAGIVMRRMPGEALMRVRETIKEFSFALFIPLYFASVGIQLNLLHQFPVLFFFIFLLLAIVVKTIGTGTAALLAGYDRLSIVNLSVAMNTRGGPCIVLATVAYTAGIIDQQLFSALIIIAIVTSLIAGTWFRFILSRGNPLLNTL